MASEGLIIDVDYNITKAEAKQQKLNREMEISRQKAENISKEIDNTKDAIENSITKQKEYSAELERSTAKLEEYRKGELDLSQKQINAELRHNQQIQKKLESEEIHQQKLESTLSKQNISLTEQNSKTVQIGGQIAINRKEQSKFNAAIVQSEKSAKRLGNRLKRVIVSALLISVVSKAFSTLRQQFGKLITETGTKTAEFAAQLKGNLSIIGTTLYETARPAIEWLLNALVKITQILATGISKILGKSVKDMKKLAENTKKTGEEAKKATASFDTLQTIDTSSKSESDSSSSSSADFSALDSEISDETAALFTIISGALLVLGVILAFTGANIGLGIGMIAVGGASLVASLAATWSALDPKIKKTIINLTKIISAAALVVGFILLATGVKIGLGIALLALGSAGIVSATAAEWNSLSEKTQVVIASIMLILTSAMLVVGIILAFTSPTNLGLGIALMVVGAVGLVSTIAIAWNSLPDKVKNTILVISAALSAALLVLGVIFAFSGANIGMGIGFMIAGAAGLATSLTVAWKTLPDKTKNIISAIMAIGGLLLLVIGIILCFSGAGIPLGVALIATGAAGLVGAATLNWNAITDKVKGVTTAISKLFNSCWNGIKDGFKITVNGLISLGNLFIDGLNALLLPVRGLILAIAKAFGQDVTLKDIKIPHIPKLATGAILPGGSPMLAWVNDQPKGQPYLEGSIDNIAAAFEKYLGTNNIGNQNITINYKGTLSQLARVLAPEITIENERASVFA